MATADPLRMGASSPEERLKLSSDRTETLERRKELLRRASWVVAFIFLVVILILSAAGVRETRAAAQSAEEAATSAEISSQAAADAADNSKALTEFVASCTTPERKCYEAQEQQDREEQAAANEITYLSSSCADQPGFQSASEIRRCVAEALLEPGGD